MEFIYQWFSASLYYSTASSIVTTATTFSLPSTETDTSSGVFGLAVDYNFKLNKQFWVIPDLPTIFHAL